ncbi:response regulator [Halorubellus sp. PRR65]|uniref:response regulator n=1 Tax=Halorubellus sp. PRR65 TaxID=3098148 RepID=UPI002B25CCCA|nr:response regulator [Halorubellus sp. PRR65]
MTPSRVVCVDDEPAFAELTATQLERHGDVTATGFTDPDDALPALDDADCVVSDYDMPGMTGLAFLEAVRDAHPDLPFVLFTGKGSEAVASEAISKGVTEYLQKSTDASQYEVLANRVLNAIDRYHAERQLDRERTLVDRIVEMTPVAIVVHDQDGDVEVANRRARDLLRMPTESLHVRTYGSSDWTLHSEAGDSLGADELPVARVIASGEEVRAERYVIEVADERQEIVLNAEPLVGADGTVERVVVVFATGEEIDTYAD